MARDYLRDGPSTHIDVVCGEEFKAYIARAAAVCGERSMARWMREAAAMRVEQVLGVPMAEVLRDTPVRREDRPRRGNKYAAWDSETE